MKNILSFLVIVILLMPLFMKSQVSSAKGGILAGAFSKEIALHEAKEYLISNILGESDSVVKFFAEPLAAASSGELTTLIYECKEKNKSGLLLGFFGNMGNEFGTDFKAYQFYNLTKEKADELLKLITQNIQNNTIFLKENRFNNIYFDFDELTFQVNIGAGDSHKARIRVFWDVFDSTWQEGAFNRTKRKFYKDNDN